MKKSALAALFVALILAALATLLLFNEGSKDSPSSNQGFAVSPKTPNAPNKSKSKVKVKVKVKAQAAGTKTAPMRPSQSPLSKAKGKPIKAAEPVSESPGRKILTGRVVDGRGLPIAGASVKLDVSPSLDSHDPFGTFWRGHSCDAEGRFRVATSFGLHFVSATAPGHQPQRSKTVDILSDGPKLVELGDLRLKRLGYGQLSLILKTPEGQPYKGPLHVEAKGRTASGLAASGWEDYDCDAKGQAQPIRGLSAGTYSLTLSCDDYKDAIRSVTLTDGQRSELIVQFDPTPRLLVTVLRRDTREPVEGFGIGLASRELGVISTNKLGQGFIKSVVPGPAKISFTSLEFEKPQLEQGSESRALKNKDIVQITEDMIEQGMTLTVLPGSRSAQGLVLNPEGEPVEGATVSLPDLQRKPLVTGPDGRFRWTNLLAGEWYIDIKHPGFLELNSHFVLPDQKSQLQLVLRLQRACVLEGRIVDEDQKPIAGVTVGAIPPSEYPPTLAQPDYGDVHEHSRKQTQTDREGRFKIKNLPSSIDLIAVKSGYQALVLRRQAIGQAELQLSMKAGGQISGRVLGSDGTAHKQSIGVFLMLESNSQVGRYVISRQGRFKVTGLRSGTYKLYADTPEGLSSSILRGVTLGQEDVVLQLHELCQVSVQIRHPEGIERPDYLLLHCEVHDPQAPSYVGRASLDEKTGLYVATLPMRSHHVRVSADGLLSASTRLALSPQVETKLTVTLERGLSVTGRVVNLGEQPVAELGIALSHGDIGQECSPGTDGQFRLSGLFPGTWTLTITRNRKQILSQRVAINTDNQQLGAFRLQSSD